MEEDYNNVKTSWWNRNWKWFVPTGCLSLILIFGFFIAGVFFEVTSMIEKSDAYKGAMEEVRKNKLVTEKLGTSIESDGMTSGTINVTNETGNCDVEVPIKGSKGTGILFVVAHKKGKWTYDVLSVRVNATQEEINLLKND